MVCVQVVHNKVKSHLTGDRSISFYSTLGVDITGVGQAVAAADLWLAALHLISCEACLTGATVEGTLCRNAQSSSGYLESNFKVAQMK